MTNFCWVAKERESVIPFFIFVRLWYSSPLENQKKETATSWRPIVGCQDQGKGLRVRVSHGCRVLSATSALQSCPLLSSSIWYGGHGLCLLLYSFCLFVHVMIALVMVPVGLHHGVVATLWNFGFLISEITLLVFSLTNVNASPLNSLETLSMSNGEEGRVSLCL